MPMLTGSRPSPSVWARSLAKATLASRPARKRVTDDASHGYIGMAAEPHRDRALRRRRIDLGILDRVMLPVKGESRLGSTGPTCFEQSPDPRLRT